MNDPPANLDDGELWLPSDIFPADEPPHHDHDHRRGPVVPNWEDLARQFNNLNFSDRRRLILSPPISQGLEVSGAIRTQYAITAPYENGCYGVNAGPTVDRGLLRSFQFGLGPPTIPAAPCQQPLRYPTHHHQYHPQATELQLMETRIGSSSRRGQQNQQQTRLFPFQEKNFGFGCYFTKNRRGIGTHAGTGVFIPRATSDHKTTNFDGVRKNPGVTPQRSGPGRKLTGMRNADQEYNCCNPQLPSSDVRLPKDWTY